MNHASVSVIPKTKVGIIATGDEIVMPGAVLNDGQIIASNTFGICAHAASSGADVLDLGISPDNRTALRDKFQTAIDEEIDVIVTTGGASVGDHDIVRPVAQDLGFTFEITKIAMRPGKPFLFARKSIGDRSVFLIGLAGNPVSSLIAFNVFVKPMIGRLMGVPLETINPLPAVLGRDLPENDERMEYMRAEAKMAPDGTRIVSPFELQDSSMLANLVRANCLLLRPAKAKALTKRRGL